MRHRQGEALFIDTPRGFNHFYELYEKARTQPHWARFQCTTIAGGNVSPQELESAAHELDERTYRQEFEASFEQDYAVNSPGIRRRRDRRTSALSVAREVTPFGCAR
ncbi:MAG: hypothetical protein C5B51_03520 [Terriglobia bacterium]|nr:MAG: hypothetical protein C5B51_03520 [Terriglobia bacterium]